ncbi:MAG: RHS repeat protein [Planctomycetes bacterium]|nr:RHS repeat protein [Planctomycetota bacterium]
MLESRRVLYDAQGSVIDEAPTTFDYDVRSNLLGVVDPNGRSIRREYDAYGRLRMMRDELNQDPSDCDEVELTYMPGRDFVVKSTRRFYDDLSASRQSYVTEVERDLVGRVVTRQVKGLDGQSAPQVHEYGYDSLGHLSFYQDPDQVGDSNRMRIDAVRRGRPLGAARAQRQRERADHAPDPAHRCSGLGRELGDEPLRRPRAGDDVALRCCLPTEGGSEAGLHEWHAAPDHDQLRCRLEATADRGWQRQRDLAGVGPGRTEVRADAGAGCERVGPGDARDRAVRPPGPRGVSLDDVGPRARRLHRRGADDLGQPGPQARRVVHLRWRRSVAPRGHHVWLRRPERPGLRRRDLPPHADALERIRDLERAGRHRPAERAHPPGAGCWVPLYPRHACAWSGGVPRERTTSVGGSGSIVRAVALDSFRRVMTIEHIVTGAQSPYESRGFAWTPGGDLLRRAWEKVGHTQQSPSTGDQFHATASIE